MNADTSTNFERSSQISDNAIRMRRYRKRRRAGLRCVNVQIREKEIDTLVGMGMLSEVERTDRRALTRALHRFFDRTLRSGRNV